MLEEVFSTVQVRASPAFCAEGSLCTRSTTRRRIANSISYADMLSSFMKAPCWTAPARGNKNAVSAGC